MTREYIEKLIELILSEKGKKYYIVFDSSWDNKYYLALDELKYKDLNISAIISQDLEDKYVEEIKNYLNFKEIIKTNALDVEKFYSEDKDKIILYLKLDRKDLIDISLLREASFSSEFALKALKNGFKVFLWKGAIEKFRCENEFFREKLISYYEEIQKLGIEIINLEAVK